MDDSLQTAVNAGDGCRHSNASIRNEMSRSYGPMNLGWRCNGERVFSPLGRIDGFTATCQGIGDPIVAGPLTVTEPTSSLLRSRS